jgi:hypothetical protein
VIYGLVPDLAVAPTAVRMPAPRTSTAAPSISIVANGKSIDEAFMIQMVDPSGQVKTLMLPEGTVLQPLTRGTLPVTDRPTTDAEHTLSQPVSAMCLEFAKLAPEAGLQYRVADQALQDQYTPLRAVVQAGHTAVTLGRLHPDSDVRQYAQSILQFAIWTTLEHWDEQHFTEMFVDQTKKNAQALHIKWTKDMDAALQKLAPGRWRDISQVIALAKRTGDEGKLAIAFSSTDVNVPLVN